MIFPRERLHRLLEVLDRQGGSETIRNLQRTYSIWSWEAEAAEKLGWVKIETRKPKTGRPSRTVYKLSETQAAKLPRTRAQIGRPISNRQWMFAMRAVMESAHRGLPAFGFPPTVVAYLRSYPTAKSRAGASASASRLKKHPYVIAAMQWFYARSEGAISKDEVMPETANEIWARLRELGSWRVSWSSHP